MPKLNLHDLLYVDSKFASLKKLIESCYKLQIFKVQHVPYLSFTSKKALLYTNKGKFFFKEKPFYCSDIASLKLSASFQNYLSQRLPFIPSYLKTLNGEDYIKFSDRFYFLTKYKDGRCFNGSLTDVKEILQSLFEFQKVARKFPHNSNRKVESFKGVQQVFSKLLPLVRSSQELKIYKQIGSLIQKLKSQYIRFEKKPFLMSHGDFSIFNIIFKDSHVIAINDFDNVQFLPRIHDLAEFFVSATLLNYIGPITDWKYPIFVKPHKPTACLILSFYKTHFNLTKNEIILFPIVVKMIWLEILLLAVLKEDYSLLDLKKAVQVIEDDLFNLTITEQLTKKIFIWDFHDTLETGTLEIITEIVNTLLKENGSKKLYTPKEITSLPSFSWEIFFKNEFPHLNKDEVNAIVEEAYNEKRFEYLNKKYSRPQKNAKVMLKLIKYNNDTNIIVSNSHHEKLGEYIKNVGLHPYIDNYIGIDDGRIKSKNDVIKKKISAIKKLIKNLNQTFQEIVLVGDDPLHYQIAEKIRAKYFYLFKPLKKEKKHFYAFENINSKTKIKLIDNLLKIKELLIEFITPMEDKAG